MRYINLRPAQALLDSENPRLPDGTDSDRSAINLLLNDDADALINLARDMAQTGQSNPAELPIAVKQGKKYIILEGNRRFAALKLLKDPSLAFELEHQQAIRRAAGLGKPPSSVFTLVMNSRAEAEHWIVLRHTGENNGRGVKRWSATQAATHRTRANKSIDSGTARSITIADEVEEAYAADSAIADAVRQVRREKLTNIGRLFSPDVMIKVGLRIEADRGSLVRERVLWSNYAASDLRDFFAWAFAHLRDKSVDSFKNAEIRRLLLEEHEYLLPVPENALAESVRLIDTRPVPDLPMDARGQTDEDGSVGNKPGDSSAAPAAESTPPSPTASPGSAPGSAAESDTGPESGTSPPPSAAQRKEAKPERYLFQGLRLPRHNRRIQRMVAEARSLEVSTFPSIACVTARVLVELAVSSDEALALSRARESDSLSEKILSMIRYLDPNADRPMRADKILAHAYLEASTLGVRYLNGFVHNPAITPDEQLARRFSSAFRPLLVRLDGAL